MTPGLWIKDTQTDPPERWRFMIRTPDYEFEVVSNAYRNLAFEITRHCTANEIEIPSEEEVAQYLCDHLTIDCRVGKDPYPNKFTRRKDTGFKYEPVLRNEWPFWAKGIALFAKDGDRGIGDIVLRLIGQARSDKFKEWHTKTFGYDCGCTTRQNEWNQQYPLH